MTSMVNSTPNYPPEHIPDPAHVNFAEILTGLQNRRNDFFSLVQQFAAQDNKLKISGKASSALVEFPADSRKRTIELIFPGPNRDKPGEEDLLTAAGLSLLEVLQACSQTAVNIRMIFHSAPLPLDKISMGRGGRKTDAVVALFSNRLVPIGALAVKEGAIVPTQLPFRVAIKPKKYNSAARASIRIWLSQFPTRVFDPLRPVHAKVFVAAETSDRLELQGYLHALELPESVTSHFKTVVSDFLKSLQLSYELHFEDPIPPIVADNSLNAEITTISKQVLGKGNFIKLEHLNSDHSALLPYFLQKPVSAIYCSSLKGVEDGLQTAKTVGRAISPLVKVLASLTLSQGKA